MLVLRFALGERAVVTCPDGTEIRVKYIKMESRKQVYIGIDAPADYVIDREEIYLRKRAEAEGRGEAEGNE